MTHPIRQPSQSFEQHQADMAAWIGTTVEDMNARHDPLHRSLSEFLGLPSHAMRDAVGELLTAREAELAGYEEEGVLFCQRWLARAGR